jgi:23S rRNA (adenine1618-N6)-methyltransferase
MAGQIKKNDTEKTGLHPRNKHRSLYDFPQLINCLPELEKFVSVNKYNNKSIDFADPLAVKTLNKALLKIFYGIDHWDIPAGYLCPPIPGRADYIHYMADVLSECNDHKIPFGSSVKCLDIGVGANCVYPIIGNKEYGWSFVGSDIDPVSARSAQQIAASNPSLKNNVEIRLQQDHSSIFKNIIQPGEQFDLSICNPPFHSSLAEAQAGTLRKLNNLGNKKTNKAVLNFGGQNAELWYKGGELAFVTKMIEQSVQLPQTCFWYSSLISKSANLPGIYYALEKANAVEIKTIEMSQGSKISRIVAWTFLTPAQQKEWKEKHWDTTKK